MRFRRCQQRTVEGGYVLRIEAKFIDLKLQQLQQLVDARLHRYRTDMEFVTGHDAGEIAPVRTEIFN